MGLAPVLKPLRRVPGRAAEWSAAGLGEGPFTLALKVGLPGPRLSAERPALAAAIAEDARRTARAFHVDLAGCGICGGDGAVPDHGCRFFFLIQSADRRHFAACGDCLKRCGSITIRKRVLFHEHERERSRRRLDPAYHPRSDH